MPDIAAANSLNFFTPPSSLTAPTLRPRLEPTKRLHQLGTFLTCSNSEGVAGLHRLLDDPVRLSRPLAVCFAAFLALRALLIFVLILAA